MFLYERMVEDCLGPKSTAQSQWPWPFPKCSGHVLIFSLLIAFTIIIQVRTCHHSIMTDGVVAVIVFLRCPKPGQVKSRLAKTIGNELACQVYELCAVRVLKSILSIPSQYSCFVFYSVSDEESEVKEWLDSHGCLGSVAGCHAQVQSDCLGERIVDAFRHVARLGYDTIAIVGTDIPDLTAGVLQMGIDILDRDGRGKCALLGPSIDGGFYMMILRGSDHISVIDSLSLDGIEWSTSTVYEDTCKTLAAEKFTVLNKASSGIPCLRDIDVLEDLIQWHQSLDGIRNVDTLESLVGEIILQSM